MFNLLIDATPVILWMCGFTLVISGFIATTIKLVWSILE